MPVKPAQTGGLAGIYMSDFQGDLTPGRAPGPVAEGDRVALMDVLRGVALFGVFLVNFVSFASVNVMATEQQVLSLPWAPLDLALFDVLRWLFFDKANT